MFLAFEVIPRPHTHESGALLRRHPLDRQALAAKQRGRCSARRRRAPPRRPLNRFSFSESEPLKLRNCERRVDELLLRLLDLLVGELHRVRDALRPSPPRRSASARCRRRSSRAPRTWGRRGRPTESGGGETCCGVVDQALRPGGDGDEVDQAVRPLDALVVAEGEPIPALDPGRVDRPQQASGSPAAGTRRSRRSRRPPESRRRASRRPPGRCRRWRSGDPGRGCACGTGRGSRRWPCRCRRTGAGSRRRGRRGRPAAGPRPRCPRRSRRSRRAPRTSRGSRPRQAASVRRREAGPSFVAFFHNP